MGVCCVKQHNQDQNEFNETTKKPELLSLLKESKDSISRIIKIQCAIRRYQAMKQLKQLKANKPTHVMADCASIPVDMSSDNSKVKELEAKLEPFKHEKLGDGYGREQRPPALLDNGAKYCGEWYIF